MLVVPVSGDTITTKDGAEIKVLSFTNFKSKGPAVYVEHEAGIPAVVIYFFDIEKINGTRVEFNTSSKVFSSLGFIKRKFHLPQPGDELTVGDKSIKVKSLKLHSKNLGLTQGLLVRDSDGIYYTLTQIDGIKRSNGTDTFDKKKFLAFYSEYKDKGYK